MNEGAPDCFRLSYMSLGQCKAAEFSQPRVLIGRSLECDVVFPVADVSRHHAAIERDDNGWTILDLNSRFGTFVNQQRVTSHRLQAGDQLAFGRSVATATFETISAGQVHESRILFDDRAGGDKISALSMDDLDRTLGAPPATAGQTVPAIPISRATEAPGRPFGSSPSAAAREPQRSRAKVSLTELFRQAGEALLTSENLEDMLGKVLNLAVAHLPAQRGFICLCDEAAETIEPKVVRFNGLAQGESITLSRSIAREAIRAREAILVTNAPTDSRFTLAGSIIGMHIQAAMCAPLYYAGHVEGILYVDTLCAKQPFTQDDLELLASLGVLTAVGILQTRLRDDVIRERAIRARLSRYSSPRIVDQIVANVSRPDGLMLAEQREVTVLFADLSGFTAIAENREPAEVVQMLNCVFTHLVEAVFQYDGTLDKFVGDGLLAIFGAPLPQTNHAERGIRAALRMQQLLAECRIVGLPMESLRMRIGVNSGVVVAGDVGSPIRKDYTVIGDAVNVAARLQSSVAKPGQIVIGQTTYDLCKHLFQCQPLLEIQLRGKRQTVRAYRVVGALHEGRDAEELPAQDPSVTKGV